MKKVEVVERPARQAHVRRWGMRKVFLKGQSVRQVFEQGPDRYPCFTKTWRIATDLRIDTYKVSCEASVRFLHHHAWLVCTR